MASPRRGSRRGAEDSHDAVADGTFWAGLALNRDVLVHAAVARPGELAIFLHRGRSLRARLML